MDTINSHRLGIDVGGTSIKAAVVDTDTGSLVTDVATAPTPPTADPAAIASLIANLRADLDFAGQAGCALPGVVDDGCLRRAPNLTQAWARQGALTPLVEQLGPGTVLLNDTDAVGLAEIHYGLGPTSGLTLVLTFGTGIGSALLHEDRLIPNAEFGELGGPCGTFEHTCSGRSITEQALTPHDWACRAQHYFDQLDRLLRPRRWIVAGGLSGSFDDYFMHINLDKPIRVAHLGPHAGIVGAAVAATP